VAYNRRYADGPKDIMMRACTWRPYYPPHAEEECAITCDFEVALGRSDFWRLTIKAIRFNEHGVPSNYGATKVYCLSDQTSAQPGKYSELKWFEFGDKLCMHVKKVIPADPLAPRWPSHCRRGYTQEDAIVVKKPAVRKTVLEWLRRHPELTSTPTDEEETAQFRSEFDETRELACQLARDRYRSQNYGPNYRYTPLEDI